LAWVARKARSASADGFRSDGMNAPWNPPETRSLL
jgi:hypothetical protein